ncbi:putative WD repeat-containing protein alr3466 OS=Nostoc sp, (strain PCC 7120 / UTEX 2576) GN=alr3466 PE=4 SV=1 [Rhizoctonia solani AG-1 IB]|uniref:Putative WD repeat-containing protein alr3466 n=1 Tax=Thanatephorus cucumeris (strain AG1-IB / isolate 7/3/14) TaxID=1108050 RepID=A0A0B7G349_THACB|nr:putative WD repeat-containing protein alr3466 OS=Nostoc sp, (strain PCC 7120 / UTEX 2576) GN=alr3466 PE=4 SV=1 [Rhizoctonia solani AG-1 IB]
MSLVSLRDSFARSKARWKKYVNTGSEGRTRLTSAEAQGIWPSVGSLLKQLQSNPEMFGPLRPLINGLSRLAEICEGLSRESDEYIELRGKIGGVLQDLSEHIKGPTGGMMPGSVKLICLYIESEVNTLEQKQSRDTGRKVLDTIEGLEGVVDCCHRVHSHLERLKLNLGLQILKDINQQTLSVDYVAVSPDGTTVVFSSYEGTAYVWDIKNGSTVTQLLPDDIPGVLCIAFSCDGSRVACGLKNGEVYICELKLEASSVVRLKWHTSRVRSVVFSPDCLHLASGSDDETVRVWDVRTGQPVGEHFGGHSSWVRSVSYSDDGSQVASASGDGTIRVWDTQKGQMVLGPLIGHLHVVSSVAISPCGTFIASGSSDKTIRVYDAHAGHTVHGPLHGHTKAVNLVMYSPDGTRLYSCSDDGTVRTWNVQDRTVWTIPGVSAGICSIRYSHSGWHVVSGSNNGMVNVHDIRTCKLVLGPLLGHDKGVTSVDYSPGDRYIASSSFDSTLRIWDTSTGNDIHGPMHGYSRAVTCVRFLADESALLSVSDDGTVRTWDVRTGQQTMQVFAGDSWILSVGVTFDGYRIACGSWDGRIRVVDGHTGNALVGPIQAHPNSVLSVGLSTNGMLLVSGSDDSSVQVRDGQTGKQIVACVDRDQSRRGGVSSVCISPNGLYVASAYFNGTVCLWDAQNGKRLLSPLKGHTGLVTEVQFSPDGSHVVSCSSDGNICRWDVSSVCSSSEEQRAIDGAEESINSSNSSTTLEKWLLDEDGWVMDLSGRQLVWLPSDLHSRLPIPSTLMSIVRQEYFEQDIEGWNIGDRWTDCYRV